RGGAALRQVAVRFGVALATVQRWVALAGKQRLDRVDWTDRPCGLPTPVNRTERHREDLVLTIRQQLHDTSDLGEFGAAAVHRELLARGIADPPSVRKVAPRHVTNDGAFMLASLIGESLRSPVEFTPR